MSLSTSCSSHVPFERSGHTQTKFQTRCNCQCNLWKRREMPVSHKLSEASRLNSLFCLCLFPKLSKSMAQPHCCCRLKQAEINGIVASAASRCVWWPPSLHEIISCLHMMSLSTSCSSHVPFERSGHTRTKFQTRCNCQCNLWKRREMPVSHKLSEASKLNSLFCLCLFPKLSKAMAQPHCCRRLKQAEINGILASRCVSRPPSLHEIALLSYDVHLIPSPPPALHVFLLNNLVMLKQIPNSFANKQMKCELCEMLKRVLCEIIRFVHWEPCLFETGEFWERLRAQSAQANSYSETPRCLKS